MQHAADFLSARDLCAMFAICARMRRAFTRDFWHAQVRARFPYKRYADDAFDGFKLRNYNPRKFALLLEDRARDGRARIFRTNMRPRWDSDMMVRGDIIINTTSGREYVFDGMSGLRVPYGEWEDFSKIIDLSRVFSIPFEFHIAYFGNAAQAGDMIAFTIDKRAKFQKTCDYVCVIAESPWCRIGINSSFSWDVVQKHITIGGAFVVLCVTIHEPRNHYHIAPVLTW